MGQVLVALDQAVHDEPGGVNGMGGPLLSIDSL